MEWGKEREGRKEAGKSNWTHELDRKTDNPNSGQMAVQCRD